MKRTLRQRLYAAWRALQGYVEIQRVVFPEPRWVQVIYFRDELLALDNLGQLWLIHVGGRVDFVVQCPPILTTPRHY